MATPSQVQASNALHDTTQDDAEIGVEIVILNQLVKPKFEHEIQVRGRGGSKLIKFLEKAADENVIFRFSATYYSALLGYKIDAFNNLAADSSKPERGTYWKISSVTKGEPLTVGVSTYEPEDQERILFEFARYTGQTTCP